jgi:hypothetical protein
MFIPPRTSNPGADSVALEALGPSDFPREYVTDALGLKCYPSTSFVPPCGPTRRLSRPPDVAFGS